MIRESIVVIAVNLAVVPSARSQVQHIVGRSVGVVLEQDAKAAGTTERITLTFGPPDAPAYTVVFAFRYAGAEMTAAPAVVDQTITRYMPDEVGPQLAIDVDSSTTMPATRLTSRSAVTTTMSFDEFVELARGDSVRERAFGADLEFSSGQLRMLKTIIDRAVAGFR